MSSVHYLIANRLTWFPTLNYSKRHTYKLCTLLSIFLPMVLFIQPVAFLRDAWRKWERKRSEKRNDSGLSHTFWPSPRRSRACRHRCASNISRPTTLSKLCNISFEDYTRPVLTSHRWVSINSSSVNERAHPDEQATTLCNKPSRSQRDKHHPPKGSCRYHASHPQLDSLNCLPVFASDDGVQVSIVERPSTDIVREQRARITSRTTRLAAVSELPTGENTRAPPSALPQPPPFLVREKVPKPLILRPADSLPSSSLVTPTSSRPGSQRSPSQTSFSSLTKRCVGRPLASLPPPPTSPPNSPLPSPPADNRRDSNLSFSPSTKCRLRASQCTMESRPSLKYS